MWSSLLLLLLVLGQGALGQRRREVEECDVEKQSRMQAEFTKCLERFTQKHHENVGKATGKDRFQKYTCQMLTETLGCGDVWSECHSPDEVRAMKDTHIAARITQFHGNSDGVDVHECDVVKEYVDSGRGDEVDQTTEGACTKAELNEVQSKFQGCSHNLTNAVWDEINQLKGRGSDDGGGEVKSRLCKALLDIGRRCALSITKCFSREDMELMRNQHIHSMARYYSKLYHDVDLSDCPALKEFSEDDDDDDEEAYYHDDEQEEEVYEVAEREEHRRRNPAVSFVSESSGVGGVGMAATTVMCLSFIARIL